MTLRMLSIMTQMTQHNDTQHNDSQNAKYNGSNKSHH
jgi:hypothetical protein